MFKLVLIGIGLITILVLILKNLWNACSLRVKGFLQGIEKLKKLEGYKDASIKCKEAEDEIKKTKIAGLTGTLLAILIIVLYFIIARHVFIHNHEHVYLESITREATCTEEGVIRHQCRYCNHVEEEPLPLIPHQYEESSRIEPTCVESGTLTETCKGCGDTRTKPISAAGNHNYAEIIVREATCTEEGVIRYHCRFCDDAYEETLPVIPHQGEETSRTDPTCVESGTITKTCIRCGNTYMKPIPKTEHRYSEVKREIPDCIKKKQIIYYRCDVCGHEKTETAAPIGKHQYIKSYSVKRSFLKVGHDIFICSVCNSQYFAIKLHEFCWAFLILFVVIAALWHTLYYIWGYEGDLKSSAEQPYFWICVVAAIILTALLGFLSARQFQPLYGSSSYSIKIDGFNWLSGIGLLLILIIWIAALWINMSLGEEGESYFWSFATLAVLMIITAVLYFIFGRQITVCIQTDAKAHIHESQQPVEITGAEASSVLNVRGEIYYVEYSYDNNIKTSWQEAAAGDGSGETITYKLDQARYIVGMDIINGRVDTKQNYYDNNRIKSLVVYYYLGDTIKAQKTVDLDDVYSMEPVHFSLIDGNLSEEYYCDSIRIEFKAVYKGQKFNDLCLTDIKFYEGTLE